MTRDEIEERHRKMLEGEGSGTDDEFEWNDSKPSPVEQITATPVEPDAQSYGTNDSQDPTHEKYEQRQQELAQQETRAFSPPTIDRNGTTAATPVIDIRITEFSKPTRRDHSPSARVQDKALIIIPVTPATARRASSSTSPCSNPPSTPAATVDPSQWQLVSASNRKAKASTGNTLHSLALRKEEEAYQPAQTLNFKPATPQTEPPAKNN
jgi:hypothetical protein